MAIHTSAITYRRGVPNVRNNFFYVAQANNAIPAPISLYLQNYQFHNRKYKPLSVYRWIWSN
jgi:hypothetical protein